MLLKILHKRAILFRQIFVGGEWWKWRRVKSFRRPDGDFFIAKLTFYERRVVRLFRGEGSLLCWLVCWQSQSGFYDLIGHHLRSFGLVHPLRPVICLGAHSCASWIK